MLLHPPIAFVDGMRAHVDDVIVRIDCALHQYGGRALRRVLLLPSIVLRVFTCTVMLARALELDYSLRAEVSRHCYSEFLIGCLLLQAGTWRTR